MSLDGHVYAEGGVRRGLLCSLAVVLASFRAVDAAETDAFSVVVVQDFEGVAVEERDDSAGRRPKALSVFFTASQVRTNSITY